MDSRLLNVFHDEPFDSSFPKYDDVSDFWSINGDQMGLQLTENLHGILPISPIETHIYGNSILKDDFHLENTDEISSGLQNTTSMLCDEYVEQEIANTDTIEIITVDPNEITYDSDSYGYSNCDEEGYLDNFNEFEIQSQCSDRTFRTRTDSSSIADYESSHPSDYEDDHVESDDATEESTHKENLQNHAGIEHDFSAVPELCTNLLSSDDLILNSSFKLPLDVAAGKKNRTISTNTNSSDIDGLGLQFDSNNFDLAEFIIKDDFPLNVNHAGAAKRIGNIAEAATLKIEYSDAESDVIVDVETVEGNTEDVKSLWSVNSTATQHIPDIAEEDISFVDNIKTDPLWSPTQMKKADKNLKEMKAVGRQKNILNQRNGKNSSKKTSIDVMGKTIQTCSTPEKREKPATVKPKIGMGRGGKNLALIERDLIQEESDYTNEESISPVKVIKQEKRSPLIKEEMALEKRVSPVSEGHTVRRKLNLEEYKKRRGVNGKVNENIEMNSEVQKMNSVECAKRSHIKEAIQCSQATISPKKHSELVTTIVRNHKGQPTSLQPINDPITEAKNKVLRMRELKKAQQLKMIDSTISAKVPRVTKLLPLKDIVKGTYCAVQEEESNTEKSKNHSVYEEIIIVSVSSNTDISIPPQYLDVKSLKTSSRSLLKSTALLYNISNSFQKVCKSDIVKISSNSLISSIQDVVVNKVIPTTNAQTSCNSGQMVVKNEDTGEQHGENKIIMHLRKDRIRKTTASVSTQTCLLPEFPPLPLLRATNNHKSRERERRKARRNYRNHSTANANEASSSEDLDSDTSRCFSRTSAPAHRSRSRSGATDSCSSAGDRVRQSDTAGGYSSRSSRRHRSSISSSYSESGRLEAQRRQRRTSHKQRTRKRSRLSSTSSLSDYSYRSRSPYNRQRSRSRSNSGSRSRRQNCRNSDNYVDRNVSQPAVEERRIVYVGRIEQETTREMLKRKFLHYGAIKQVTIHYKETGMKYGFITYDRSEDAFRCIDNSAQDAIINMYDISFGGRRAFCRASYADLDNAGINNYQSYVFPKATASAPQEESFESLLLKVKQKINASKTLSSASNGKSSKM